MDIDQSNGEEQNMEIEVVETEDQDDTRLKWYKRWRLWWLFIGQAAVVREKMNNVKLNICK